MSIPSLSKPGNVRYNHPMITRMTAKTFNKLFEPHVREFMKFYHDDNLSLKNVVIKFDQSWITYSRLVKYVRRNGLRPIKRASPTYITLKKCEIPTCGNDFIPKVWNQKCCVKCMPNPHHSRYLYQQFGLTQGEFDALYESHNGQCAGCLCVLRFGKGTRYGGNNLNIDHDHRSGKIRGLLCNTCNRAIGYLKDNIETLKRLASYLERQQEFI